MPIGRAKQPLEFDWERARSAPNQWLIGPAATPNATELLRGSPRPSGKAA